jgi:hypothetical protein
LRAGQALWWTTYLFVLLIGLTVAAFAYRREYQPFLGVALAVLLLVVVGWFFAPRGTLFVTVFFSLVGDISTVGWFPFNKNLSSRESILFISDGISISPLELVLLTGLAVTIIKRIADGRSPLSLGVLGLPFIVFTATVFGGLGIGLARGGDFRAAMFEMRPLLYLPSMYFLVTAWCTERRHHRQLTWWIVSAVLVQALLSIDFYLRLSDAERADLERLTEHGSAMSMNFVFLFLFASLAYKGVSAWQRIVLLAASVPITVVYLISQRRAGVATLVVGLILFAISLFWRQRRTFWKVVPVMAVVSLAYLGAFWSSDSTLGFPAEAVKTVVAPDDATIEDEQSDAYRSIENLNVSFTVQSAPITGLGFGQPFYRPFRLPDISRFEFNAYVPHNSFLWIWIKTGFVGFATTVYLFGRSVLIGADRFRRVPSGTDAAVAFASVSFVAIYAIYTYVDIGWGSRNMVLLGAMMAVATTSVPPRRGTADAAVVASPVQVDRQVDQHSLTT